VSSGQVAVETVGLHHRYGQREALRDVAITIGRGEVFALLGQS